MMILFDFFISILSLVTIAYGCGMSVHNEVTTRAMYSFNPTIQEYSKYANYLRKNPQFVQAGSFFPDWGYKCWKNDELSEIAHWPPFIKAATEYIREKYQSESWDQDEVAQGIISFIYAIASHGIADVTFHSLGGIHDGFIAAMAEVNFKQDYDAAHSAADMGGEFTLSHMVDLNYLEDEWQVPIDDIIEIYKSINKTASKKHINYCIKQAFTAMQANKKFGKIFFSAYGEKSPFLIERLEDYYRGGINNMAADVHECWHNLSYWFENGPRNDYFSLCDPFKENLFTNDLGLRNMSDFDKFFRTYSYELLTANGYAINDYKDKHGITHYEIHRRPKDSLSILSFPEEIEKSVNNERSVNNVRFNQIFQDINSSPDSSQNTYVRISSSRWINHHLTSDYPVIDNTINSSSWISKCQLMPTNQSLFINLDLPYSYSLFGHDMVTGDFNGDGIQDLVISAPLYDENTNVPHTGAVFILYGKSTLREPLSSTNILELSDQILYANDPLPQSRFGWSLAVVDLNSDGIDDLAISAPLFGVNRLTSTGKVYVYFGHAEPTGILNLFRTHEIGLSHKPDLEISSDAKMVESDWSIEEMGEVLASGDIDNDGFRDLLIGCPYCGLNGQSKTRASQAGRIFLFQSSKKHIGNKTIFDCDWSLHSPSGQNYEWFGAAIGVHHMKRTNNYEKSDNTIIIVGAPGYNNQLKTQWAGRVYGFKIMRDGDKMSPLKIFDLSGIEEFQGIGSDFKFYSSIIAGDFLENVGDFLVITSQSETSIQRFPIYNKLWQAGAVRVINMEYLKEGTLLSDDYMSVGNGLLSLLRGTESASHFGSGIYWDDIKNSLWVSEPLASWEAGHIFSYPLKSFSFHNYTTKPLSQNTPNLQLAKENVPNVETFKLADICIKSREPRARFGNKIIKFDFNGDGKRDLIIASEHSSQSIRLGGSVTILLE